MTLDQVLHNYKKTQKGTDHFEPRQQYVYIRNKYQIFSWYDKDWEFGTDTTPILGIKMPLKKDLYKLVAYCIINGYSPNRIGDWFYWQKGDHLISYKWMK